MIRPIAITAVMNGFVVTVGCQTVVFNDAVTLCGSLHSYLTNPEETEQQFAKHPNARHTYNALAPATPTGPSEVNQCAEAPREQMRDPYGPGVGLGTLGGAQTQYRNR